MALSRSFAAVTTLLIPCASGASCWAVGDAGSCSIVVERLETEDFSALVWLGKSCFAELTTASALLRTVWRSVCRVERASLSVELHALEVVDRLLELGLSDVLCGVGVTDRPVGAGKASHVQSEVDIQRGRVVSVGAA